MSDTEISIRVRASGVIELNKMYAKIAAKPYMKNAKNAKYIN